MNYDQTDYSYLSLRSWINVIVGKMTSIDRRKKHILINDQTVLPYDHLILCTGEQYYSISPMSNKVWNAYSKQEVKPHLTRPLFGKTNSRFNAYAYFPRETKMIDLTQILAKFASLNKLFWLKSF